MQTDPDPDLARLRNAVDLISTHPIPARALELLGGTIRRPHEPDGPGWGCSAELLGIRARGMTGDDAVAAWCHFARVRCALPALIPAPLATIS